MDKILGKVLVYQYSSHFSISTNRTSCSSRLVKTARALLPQKAQNGREHRAQQGRGQNPCARLDSVAVEIQANGKLIW